MRLPRRGVELAVYEGGVVGFPVQARRDPHDAPLRVAPVVLAVQESPHCAGAGAGHVAGREERVRLQLVQPLALLGHSGHRPSTIRNDSTELNAVQ